MQIASTVQRARDRYDARAWSDAYEELHAADAAGSLDAEDLDRLAIAANMTGRDAECDQTWERAHRAWLERGEPAKAARCAFWLSTHLNMRGEHARAGGWLARAARLLEEHGQDCAEQGLMRVPEARRLQAAGRCEEALALFEHAAQIAERFGDRDALALSRMSIGQCLIALGEVARGVALLDEVLLGVVSGEVGPVQSGIIYCAVIGECQALFDLRRAQEWTNALDDWSRPQQGLVPFRGQCLVHRSELMQLRGEWADAVAEAGRAVRLLSTPHEHPMLGFALCHRAELHRLRGEYAEAEQAYRAAGRSGREPQPGLALLRLAQGRVDVAYQSIRRVLEEARTRPERFRLLAAHIDIALAAGDVAAARRSADELAAVARELNTPLGHAVSGYGSGAVLLAEGDPAAAYEPLRRARELWQELAAPYGAARAGALLGVVCRERGDTDTAELEFDSAEETFRRLGAGPDLERVRELRADKPATDGPLTAREAEVLALAAAGRTNRQIAAELFLSEHTVRRHLQNVFAKLGVSSRAAATAYALQHGLI